MSVQQNKEVQFNINQDESSSLLSQLKAMRNRVKDLNPFVARKNKSLKCTYVA